ncbi:MAG: ribonuclease III [Lentisphaeria bacterium]
MKIFNPKASEMPEVFAHIEAVSAYSFQNQALLLLALTHSSYAAEQNPTCSFNQRLEFLGDAVLQLILSEFLYTGLPQAQEGILTRTRSLLAKEKANAEYALKLGLDQALLLGNGENLTGGRQRESILGDVFEAFLGAVYLDGGLEAARAVCNTLLPPAEDCLELLGLEENPKGMLLEYCQSTQSCKPEYVCLSANGPVHEPTYEVKVMLNGQEIAKGNGKNRKAAECEAAKKAMLQRDWEKTGQNHL